MAKPKDVFGQSGAVLVFNVPHNDFTSMYLMDANNAACNLLGYDESQIKNLSPNQLHESPDAAELWKTVYTLRDNGECDFRWILKRRNGSNIPVRVTAKIIESDSMTLIFASIWDHAEEDRAKRLVEEHARFNALLQNSADVFAIVDEHNVFQYISPAANVVFGYTDDEHLGANAFDDIHPDDLNQLREIHNEVVLGIGGAVTAELRIRRKDGSWVHCEVSADNRLHEPNINGIVVTFRDLTDRKRIEQELRNINERFRAFVKYSTEIFVIVDKSGIVQYVSEAASRVIGYDASMRIGRDMCELIHPDDVPWMRRFHRNLLQKSSNQNLNIELRFHDSDNQWRDLSITGCNLCDVPSINGIVLNYHDITEQKQAQRLLNHMAYHDTLTDIPNRRAFEEHFESQLLIAKMQQTQLAVLYIGLDRFSYINDTFGHAMGDRLLRQIAERLTGCLDSSVMLSRVNGDEFIALVSKGNDVTDFTNVADTILRTLEYPFELDNYELYVTASIGMSIYPDDGADIETLMKHADMALSRAKGLGKGQLQIFTPTMNVETYKNFVIHNDLHKAIVSNELSVVYQPRVQTKTGRIVSAEALVRWNHPEWGHISPKDFIPIAEETGLIVPLGEWVLRTVSKQNKSWQDAGLMSIPISVNFSGLQFLKPDVIETIAGILEETGLEGEWLEIEITESALLENEEILISAIQSLQQMGIQAAIDDFGTGYSSLSRLKNSSMKTLKIDRSFVQGVDQDASNATITKSIIEMAHGLGMTVVAEGVETKSELQYLMQHNCDEIQGYLFNRPVPAEEFEKLLRKKTLSIDGLTREPVNRRRYFRIKVPAPLLGEMSISRIRGRSVSMGTTSILIEDIGPGGLRFLSHIRLPINPDIILRFDCTVYDNISVQGHIVWCDECDGGLQLYGVEFFTNEEKVSDLVKNLNKLAVELRQHHRRVLAECKFYEGNVGTFFREQSSKS